eukprot:6100820-Pyramimonas_sp.AAC.1
MSHSSFTQASSTSPSQRWHLHVVHDPTKLAKLFMPNISSGSEILYPPANTEILLQYRHNTDFNCGAAGDQPFPWKMNLEK